MAVRQYAGLGGENLQDPLFIKAPYFNGPNHLKIFKSEAAAAIIWLGQTASIIDRQESTCGRISNIDPIIAV